MNNVKRFFSVISVFGSVVFYLGTGWSQAGGPAAGKPELTAFLIDDFENSHYWRMEMPVDYGVYTMSRREGAPRSLKDLEGHKNVLGVRVSFFNGGVSKIRASLFPPRPVPIPGLVDKFRVWIIGRGTRSSLQVLVVDPEGTDRYVNMGSLDFLGWKQIEGSVPETMRYSDARKRSVRHPSILKEGAAATKGGAAGSPSSAVQEESQFFAKVYGQSPAAGLVFKGFVMEFDGTESRGNYYTYFDNLEALVDKSYDTVMDSLDNMVDDW